MFLRSAKRITGITMARKIMMPPIVGVPFFCSCPSSPRSRISSPICFFLIAAIIFLPAKIEKRRAVENASMALNDRYWNSPCPGMSKSFRKSNKWYIMSVRFSVVYKFISEKIPLTISFSSK